MADEEISSQVATDAPGEPEAGTTESSVTDASAGAEEQPSATPPESGTTDESVTAESAEVAPETSETKSRRERQRESRKAPPPAPQPTPDEIIAAYRKQEDQRIKTESEQRARVERNAKWLGETVVDHDGEQVTEFERLRRVALKPVEPGTTYEDLEAHNAAVARYNELSERRQLLANEVDPIRQSATEQARAEALQWIGNQFETGLTETGLNVQSVLSAGAAAPPDQRMPAIVKALAAQIEAKHAPRVAELEDELAAANSEIDTWKRRAGGEAAQVDRGGVPNGVISTPTLQKLLSQPDFAERAMRGEFANLDLTASG